MTDEEMAAALRAKGWRVAPPITKETCRHVNMRGSVSFGADGGTKSSGYCPECGYFYNTETKGDPSPLLNYVVRN